MAAGLVVVVSVGGWYAHRWSREKWALKATADITRLIDAEEFTRAAALIQDARAILPKDPTLEKLWLKATVEVTVESDPPGAEVASRPLKGDPERWNHLGQTPLQKVRVPRAIYVFRVTKPGFATVHLLGWKFFVKPVRLVSVRNLSLIHISEPPRPY